MNFNKPMSDSYLDYYITDINYQISDYSVSEFSN